MDGVRKTVELIPGPTAFFAAVISIVVTAIGALTLGFVALTSGFDRSAPISDVPAQLWVAVAIVAVVEIAVIVWQTTVSVAEKRAGYSTVLRNAGSDVDLVHPRTGIVFRAAGESLTPSEIRIARAAAGHVAG